MWNEKYNNLMWNIQNKTNVLWKDFFLESPELQESKFNLEYL